MNQRGDDEDEKPNNDKFIRASPDGCFHDWYLNILNGLMQVLHLSRCQCWIKFLKPIHFFGQARDFIGTGSAEGINQLKIYFAGRFFKQLFFDLIAGKIEILVVNKHQHKLCSL